VRASLVSASERDNSSAANVSNLHDATEATHSPSPRVKGTGD
jgi:hypothetical protein